MIPGYKDYDYMISLHILYGVNLIIDYLNMYLKKITFRLPGKNSWPQNKLQNKCKCHCLHKSREIFYFTNTFL